MTTSKTNAEWQQEIQALHQKIETESARPTAAIDVSSLSDEGLAALIDHTILKLDASEEQVDMVLQEALKYSFKTACIRLPHVSRAAALFKDRASPRVCCVIGFHEGTYTTVQKLDEARAALDAGAGELDFVLNRAPLQGGDYEGVFAELAVLAAVAEKGGAVSKIILETSQLSEGEIVAAAYLGLSAGFDFVKTSTGFVGHGATVDHVALMRKVVELGGFQGAGVKASGGIRTWVDAKAMIEAGASRLGVSAGIAILEGFRGSSAQTETQGGSGY